jgi:hypothetical protein
MFSKIKLDGGSIRYQVLGLKMIKTRLVGDLHEKGVSV